MSTEDLLKEYNVLVSYEPIISKILNDSFKNFDEIKKYFNENYNSTEENKRIIFDYLEFALKDDGENYIEDYIVSKFSEINKSLTLEEKIKNIKKINFFDDNTYWKFQDFLSKDEKQELLDNIDDIEPIPFKLKRLLKETCYDSELLDYINSEGKNKLLAMDAYVQGSEDFWNLFYNLNSEYNKALACIKFNVLPPKNHLVKIKDDYIRSRVILYGLSYEELGVSISYKVVCDLDRYKKLKEKFDLLDNEKEKTDFICSIDDNDIKLSFLKEIKEKENRVAIINSFENEIEPELSSEVKLVQDMIREFWEDSLGEQFTEDKREKMEIVFNRSNVNFSDIEYCVNGRSKHLEDRIVLNNNVRNRKSLILGYLVHEYGHLFSNFTFKINQYFCGYSKAVEEGTQDLFSELVINHYLEKHGEIKLDGKKIFVQNPYISYSGYDFENVWQRTILYPLQEQGLDKLALAEYQLGDKNKYLELVYGKEIADSKPRDEFGNPDVNTNYSDIYYAHRDSFENVDHNSIYYRRNWLLPAFELQKRLPDINFFGLKDGEYYNCSFVANKYFNNRKVFEIEPEELSEFIRLVKILDKKFVGNFDKYINKTINELTDDEINLYSFEILENEAIILGNLCKAGTNMMHNMGRCFEIEQMKVSDGQSLEESLTKYKAIVPKYLKLLSTSDENANIILIDDVRQLQQMYLNQLNEALQEDRKQTVEMIQKMADSNLWLDEEMMQVLESNGVNVETIITNRRRVSSKDISKAAIKGKITLREIGRYGIALESGKTTDRDNKE